MRSGRVVSLVLLVVLVLLVNAPLATRTYVGWQVSREGETVRVPVVDSRAADTLLQLDYSTGLPGDRGFVTVRVDRATYDAATASGLASVRRVPGEPQRFRVQGALTSRVPLVTTLALDGALVAGAVLLSRLRRRPELVLRATGDLVPAEPGPVLERTEGQRYVVTGVHHEGLAPGEVRLDLGDRWVRVLLDGHAARAPVGEAARVVGVMVG